MIHKHLKNDFEIYRLLGLDGDTNYFNWTFFQDKAVVRQEKNTWVYHKSNLVEFQFDRSKNILTTPKVLYTDDIISYEDPRLVNENDICYVKVNRPKDEIDGMRRAGDFKVNLMFNDIDCNKKFNKVDSYEKNWQFENNNEFLYSINPYIIYQNNQYVNKGNFPLTNFKYGKDQYNLSTNKFTINNRQFIFFHTQEYVNDNFVKYYQGVLEIKDNKPITYCKEPFFYPSDYLSDKNKLSQIFRFREISESILYRYQLGYFSTARVENNKLNISCGLNECESVLLSINCEKFVDWYDSLLQTF